MGIKEFFKRLKEDNAGFAQAMKRINAPGFCGNVNRGIKNGDFWEGSYLSLEGVGGVIYGSSQPDYFFTGDDVESFEPVEGAKCTVSKGNEQIPAVRCLITFNDGKRAQVDFLPAKLTEFQLNLKL
ncbi:MAG: hypothetical protein IJX74_03170 [Clostridia bacterium]|nr:hypothetical protein [Clostridia bacterium]